MENAYFRVLEYTKQCELAFHLKLVDKTNGESVLLEDELRSVRQLTDTVESLLQHTKNKIIKMLGNNENIELHLSLKKGNKNINGATVCHDLIKQYCKPINPTKSNNLTLKVCRQTFVVVINAPLINLLSLPNVLYVDYPVQAVKFKAIFTEKHLCNHVWYTSSDNENWDVVGNDYKYTPSPTDLNKHLKLICVPQNDRVEGPPFEVISSSQIQKMCPIPRCPFEDRHKFTNNKLKESKFRVVSYNSLSAMYCDNIQFPYCTSEILSIDYRKQLILKELQGYNADIICLQEMDQRVFNSYLKPKLTKRYISYFHKKGNRLPEGLACFYCRTRFRLLSDQHIVFAEELRSNPLFKSTLRMLNVMENVKEDILKQPTSLQVTVLLKKDTNEVVIVANTHLYYRPEANDVRLIQGSLALDYLSEIVRRCKRDHKVSKVGVIFCGDFNSVPEAPLYNFFNNRIIQHTFESNSQLCLDAISLRHPFKFVSAYGAPKYTNYTEDFKGCLDYIFYEEDKFSVVECIPFPDESVLSENIAIPSKVFPSDHIALVTDLQLL